MADTLYRDAAFASRRLRAHDDFSRRANGALHGAAPLLGPAWVTTPDNDSLTYHAGVIASGKLTVADESDPTTAMYASLNLGGAWIREIVGIGSFTGGDTTSASLPLLITADPADGADNGHITGASAKCIHTVFTPTQAICGYFNGAGLVSTTAYTYPAACALDGTEYLFGYEVDYARNQQRLILPDGSRVMHHDPLVSTCGGAHATFEIYKQAGNPGVPRWRAVGVG